VQDSQGKQALIFSRSADKWVKGKIFASTDEKKVCVTYQINHECCFKRMQVNSQHLFVKHDPVFVITNRTYHPPLPVVDSIEGKAAFFLKRVKTAIADTELVGEAVYYHAVWNGWFNRYFFCILTGIGKENLKLQSSRILKIAT